MARNVAIGIQDFEKLIVNNCFYVDKSDFIRQLLEDLYVKNCFLLDSELLTEKDKVPMQEAYVYGFWGEIVSLIRSMFNSAFKTNP